MPAHAITNDDLGPCRAICSGRSYEDDKEHLASPYWTREFVGVGPYRMTEWQPEFDPVRRVRPPSGWRTSIIVTLRLQPWTTGSFWRGARTLRSSAVGF
jgi:hypothetical protein